LRKRRLVMHAKKPAKTVKWKSLFIKGHVALWNILRILVTCDAKVVQIKDHDVEYMGILCWTQLR